MARAPAPPASEALRRTGAVRVRIIARRRHLFDQLWLPLGMHVLVGGQGWACWSVIDGEKVFLLPDSKEVILESFWTPRRIGHLNKFNGNCTCPTCNYWKARGKYRVERQHREREWRVEWEREGESMDEH